VRVLVLECQRRDPQFVERCRQQLDFLEPPIEGPVPLEIREQIKVKQRETFREILDIAEKAAPILKRRLASSKWRACMQTARSQMKSSRS
jgi:hypothetical protein